jgi:hypothetical protein
VAATVSSIPNQAGYAAEAGSTAQEIAKEPISEKPRDQVVQMLRRYGKVIDTYNQKPLVEAWPLLSANDTDSTSQSIKSFGVVARKLSLTSNHKSLRKYEPKRNIMAGSI